MTTADMFVLPPVKYPVVDDDAVADAISASTAKDKLPSALDMADAEPTNKVATVKDAAVLDVADTEPASGVATNKDATVPDAADAKPAN
jgi:hypothetical protein